MHFFLGPFVEAVEEFTALTICRAWCRDSDNFTAAIRNLGKDTKACFALIFKEFRHIGQFKGDTQIGFIRAIFFHRLFIGDAREWRLHFAAICELFKHTCHDGFNRLEDIFLGDKAHFDIELIKLTW